MAMDIQFGNSDDDDDELNAQASFDWVGRRDIRLMDGWVDGLVGGWVVGWLVVGWVLMCFVVGCRLGQVAAARGALLGGGLLARWRGVRGTLHPLGHCTPPEQVCSRHPELRQRARRRHLALPRWVPHNPVRCCAIVHGAPSTCLLWCKWTRPRKPHSPPWCPQQALGRTCRRASKRS